MNFRWTMKELKEITNKRLIIALIAERTSELNGYCPLAQRLNELNKWVEMNLPDNG